ncbi:hypothetical protein [Methyloglobulus sp.]|uniref:hypothetical protein n=1 Tax=Methyloglobulus sp. TaxID=2518622 RepID=UPI0032B78242
MTTPEIITAIKDVFLGIAAATTAIVAVLGLKNWSRELKGKTEFEVARNLIRTTYKLRDEIQNCRSPFISAYEFPKEYKGGSRETSSEDEAQAWSYVYKNRWASVYNAILEFDSHTLEAEALWDKEVRNRTDSLRQCVQELYAAIEALVSDKANRGEDFKSDREYGKQIRSTVSASPGDKNNEFSKKMLIAVSAIEEQIRPHLRRSS